MYNPEMLAAASLTFSNNNAFFKNLVLEMRRLRHPHWLLNPPCNYKNYGWLCGKGQLFSVVFHWRKMANSSSWCITAVQASVVSQKNVAKEGNYRKTFAVEFVHWSFSGPLHKGKEQTTEQRNHLSPVCLSKSDFNLHWLVLVFIAKKPSSFLQLNCLSCRRIFR